jgi:large repetitive protein
MSGWRRAALGLLAGMTGAVGVSLPSAHAAPAPVNAVLGTLPTLQAVPGHTSLVPDKPRTNTPRISNGEISDIEVVPQLNRVFIAGSFTSLQNTTGNTQTVSQRYLASYNYNTGLIDTSFRPTFGGGGVNAVEASPDGTKLFVSGTFNTVNGTTRQKVASLNLTTGAPIAGFDFTRSTNNQVNALAATNTTLYAGGRFSRINGALKTGLAAINATTGAVDQSFSNDLSGGVGVNGALTVQQLKLTHDETKLVVIHTGRQIAGQDRLGIGIIDTATKQLLPWRTRLWDENLGRVGGVTRIYNGDIAPDDSYFVVSSGSGGDAPPISDTAVAYPLTGGDDVQPLWIHRAFDSIYSVAITEQAVYIGGHFQWNESPTSCGDPSLPRGGEPCWAGLDNVGYGTGQGLSGYGLGDAVVRRDHLGALDPVTGRALEWNPGSNSFEGNKAMEATARGLFVGGDGMFQGGVRTGRVAFYDLNTLPAASSTDTTITSPIEGRVEPADTEFSIEGTAKNPQGIRRVQVEIQDRNSKQFLQDDGTTWRSTNNNFYANLGAGTTNRTWSLPVTVSGNREVQIMAKTFGTNGQNDSTKAVKKIETFGLSDQTPSTSISGPSGIQTDLSFTMTGTANDDNGVSSLSFWFRDDSNRYLQSDGTVSAIFNTFRGTPDVIGATNATWSYDVTLPHEGTWRLSATAVDTAGQSDLRSATRDVVVNSSAQAPTVTISQPVAMTPPFSVPSDVVAPGSPITFAGTATDESSLKNVEITLRNSSTREYLGSDCSWGVDVRAGNCRVSPVNIGQPTYNWSYTTPFNLKPGTYSFTVRATDNDDLSTSSSNRGQLTVLAQIPGDSPPDGRITGGGTFAVTDPNIPLVGTATDDIGVSSVELLIQDNDTGRYLQDNGIYNSTYNTVSATLAAPDATSTDWTYALVLPGSGDYRVTAYAYDTSDQQDPSTSGATSRYTYYPDDLPPGFNENLGQPVSGTAFSSGTIVVTGRAEDDISIARVDVAVVDSAGLYMSSSGSFTSTRESWRTAFLNSPGSAASNFSYTTPVIPDGTYTVLVRAVDHHDQISEVRTSTGVTVTSPANDPPVASATVSCVENVCSFDGRGSTDENPLTLTYSWSFGQGSGSGPVPTKTYAAPGTYSPTLTVRDEWGVSSAPFALPPITIVEPSGNVAPVPTFVVNCVGFVCSTSSSGTDDPNDGDTFSNSWDWGDLTTPSTGNSPTHTYAGPGPYAITLTTTDGWGKAATFSRQIDLAEPGTNRPPTAAFTATCTGLMCTMSSAGTADPDGDQLRYSWAFGDGATSTSASPSRTFAAEGTYSVTLTVTDVWGRTGIATHDVTVSGSPAGGAPVAVIATPVCSSLSCSFDGSGSSDAGGSVASYAWSFGDGTPTASGSTTAHTYAADGTYTVSLTVTDNDGQTGTSTRTVSVAAPTQAAIGFRAASESTGNSPRPATTVPGAVRPGDVMVLALSINRTTSISNPSGWTAAGSQAGGSGEVQTRLWTRVATAADAGSSVSATLGTRAKFALTLAAYSGVDSAAPVVAAVGVAETSKRAAHSTPAVASVGDGNWLLSYWTDKSSATSQWNLPAGQSVRSEAIGSGSGRMTAVLADSQSGSGGVVATADATSNKAVMWSVVLNRA